MRWMSAFRAYAECISRGAYTPRSCVAVRTSAGETTIFAMHKRTFAQERRASARRGSEMRWWTQCDFRRGTHAVHKSGGRQPAVAIGITGAVAFVCGAFAFVRHGWLTPAAPGAHRTFATKCVIRNAESHTQPRAAGVSPPWLGTAMVDAMRLPSGNARRAQERRASARRGWANSASADTSVIRRQTADGVCADCRCGRGHRRHGANVAPESFMGHTAPDYNRVH
jgi:hypothetical protein